MKPVCGVLLLLLLALDFIWPISKYLPKSSPRVILRQASFVNSLFRNVLSYSAAVCRTIMWKGHSAEVCAAYSLPPLAPRQLRHPAVCVSCCLLVRQRHP